MRAADALRVKSTRPSRFRGRKKGGEGSAKPSAAALRRRARRIPDAVLNDAELNAAIRKLPLNYEFEVHKTVWRLQQENASVVALQFPEGLLMYACVLCDIFEHFCGVRVIIMADVTYGACCVDDFTARALGADFLVHYGHSCLVTVDTTTIKTLYVFVDVGIDVDHLVATIKLNFPDPTQRLTLLGTIQFGRAIHAANDALKAAGWGTVDVPQCRPLSAGEVLGCTSPTIAEGTCDALIFVADGRFHLESAMIANPELPAYRYNPFDKAITRERYDTVQMKKNRLNAIERARGATTYGVILGTLGRQGNTGILNHICAMLTARGHPHIVLLLSEIFPAKLTLLKEVDAWVQIACPRLSVDWGHFFTKPLLSTYEFEVAMDRTLFREVYPMDYYRKDGGSWSNNCTERGDPGGAKEEGGCACAAGEAGGEQSETGACK